LDEVPAVSIVSPVFEKERTDKQANEQDAGFNQIADRIDICEDTEEQITLAPSQQILRELYVKEGKNGKAFRKFAGWKTNKEARGKFPAYVLFYSDFSAGRKEPLEADIYMSPTEDDMKEKIDALIDENIKKGWNKVN